MWRRPLIHRLATSILPCGYAVLVIIVLATENNQFSFHPWLLYVAAGAALGAWLLTFRRYHTVTDTPTARISSAPQGYVELVGEAAVLPGAPLLGFGEVPPCVWYRYSVTRGNSPIDSGQSHDTFLVRDQTGECVIDPDLAEVFSTATITTWRGEYCTRAQYLVVGQSLYVIGEFSTLGGTEMTLNRREDIRALLGEWKRDSNTLHARFDSDGDGQIDMQEWQVARRAAATEVDARHDEVRQRADTHLIRAPEDGRPFILANVDPARLARRYLYWTWVHAVAFVVTLVGGLASNYSA